MVEREGAGRSLGLEVISNANGFGTVSVMVGGTKAESRVLAQIEIICAF